MIRNRIIETKKIRASDLLNHPSNWRIHPGRQKAALQGAVDDLGQVQALTVRKTKKGLQIIDGHLRKEVFGDQMVTVNVTDLNEVEAKKALLTLDPIAAMATRNDEMLTELASGVKFDNAALQKLLETMGARHAKGGGDAPTKPFKNPGFKVGALFGLGKHRLLCGDSTSQKDVIRLMNGERAGLMATDPPYLVDYTAGNRPSSKMNKGKKNKNWDSYVDPETSIAFFESFIRIGLEHALNEAPAIYQWHASIRQILVEQAWKANDLLLHQQIIWVKEHAIPTYCHFMWQHEPCFYGWKNGHKPPMKPAANLTTVWPISQVGHQDGIHPTQKPLEIFAIPIRAHTMPGEIVYEPFSGSGSQLIAAEESDRVCYAMELAPEYVAAAVNRWEKFTGKKAKRLG
jgi:DNA modification methylase